MNIQAIKALLERFTCPVLFAVPLDACYIAKHPIALQRNITYSYSAGYRALYGSRRCPFTRTRFNASHQPLEVITNEVMMFMMFCKEAMEKTPAPFTEHDLADTINEYFEEAEEALAKAPTIHQSQAASEALFELARLITHTKSSVSSVFYYQSRSYKSDMLQQIIDKDYTSVLAPYSAELAALGLNLTAINEALAFNNYNSLYSLVSNVDCEYLVAVIKYPKMKQNFHKLKSIVFDAGLQLNESTFSYHMFLNDIEFDSGTVQLTNLIDLNIFKSETELAAAAGGANLLPELIANTTAASAECKTKILQIMTEYNQSMRALEMSSKDVVKHAGRETPRGALVNYVTLDATRADESYFQAALSYTAIGDIKTRAKNIIMEFQNSLIGQSSEELSKKHPVLLELKNNFCKFLSQKEPLVRDSFNLAEVSREQARKDYPRRGQLVQLELQRVQFKFEDLSWNRRASKSEMLAAANRIKYLAGLNFA